MFTFATTGIVLATDSTTEPSGGLLSLLLPLIVIGGLFYFLLIMPQRRMRKQAEEMRSSLAVGDRVRTVGGIYGSIESVDGETVVLDVGGGTRLTIAVRAIAQTVHDTDTDPGEA